MSKRKIKVEDLRNFRFVSDPQVSPDGGKIAFVLSTIDYEKDAYERHIWMADRASGEVRQFTFGTGNDTFPRWSPDGRHLLFLSSGSGSDEKRNKIWVIPRSGGDARLAAETDEGVSKPAWASDSKRLLFISKVWTEKKPDTDVKVIKRISYKLNGVGFFEGRRPHLFVTRLGEKAKQLTKGEYDVETAVWSTDGKSIAFVANMNEDADTNRVRDIFLVPSKGGELRKVTEGKHVISNISISPDGQHLAFIGHDKPNEKVVNRDLWVMPLDGGEKRNLTSGFDRNIEISRAIICADLKVGTPNPGAVWSHDGDAIYFLTGSTPHSNVYKVAAGDGSAELFIGNRVIDGFSMSADGSVFTFNVMDSTHPAELWVNDDDGERRLTNFNERLLEGLDLSTPERFTFRNDLGEDIDGWIMRPVSFNEEKYPTVLEIHGGPRNIFGDGIFIEFQVLAANGFAVIYTNPRGSGGYGEDYAKAVIDHRGECAYEDLMAFVDEALKRYPFIDESQLGVTGGSYGGYMTNWIVAHTDRFKAAVTCRSICNWVSKLSSDTGYRGPESVASAEEYWDAMIRHMEESPIMYAKNVKTPTLIIQAENDLRCPMDQAEQWFAALKLQGVPTELIRFPNENHDLSRDGNPKHREERLWHILRWFKKYLKPSSKR